MRGTDMVATNKVGERKTNIYPCGGKVETSFPKFKQICLKWNKKLIKLNFFSKFKHV